MKIAMTREVSPAINECVLTHLHREAIDLAAARAQHRAYEECLAEAGCTVERLAAAADLPDSVFIEDTALVFGEVAVITRPGAPARLPETASVAAALGRYRPLRYINAPATIDGGDVLALGRRVFVGRSGRTNVDATGQLGQILGMFGYSVEVVPVRGCLHLKSAVSVIADDLLLINRRWVPAEAFPDVQFVDVDPAEPFAANALRVDDAVIYSSAFPDTQQRLEERGVRVRTVDVSELAKAEGGVTCCSLIFNA